MMVFSTRIRKLGKSDIVNGFVKQDKKATLYYSKANKVYSRVISLHGAISNEEYAQFVADEILPVTQDVSVVRIGETISVKIK
ncbi:MAG: hypothetical protein IJS68_03375 [Clostridia bacterium]|nr:hypothetical protein [Clostridia bacterium]